MAESQIAKNVRRRRERVREMYLSGEFENNEAIYATLIKRYKISRSSAINDLRIVRTELDAHAKAIASFGERFEAMAQHETPTESAESPI